MQLFSPDGKIGLEGGGPGAHPRAGWVIMELVPEAADVVRHAQSAVVLAAFGAWRRTLGVKGALVEGRAEIESMASTAIYKIEEHA